RPGSEPKRRAALTDRSAALDVRLMRLCRKSSTRPWGGPMRRAHHPGRDEGRSMGVSEVSTILWRQRELLEMLLFKLEEEQLVLATGRTRWLARSAREVEVVLAEIRRTELLRAVEVESLATELGLQPGPS